MKHIVLLYNDKDLPRVRAVLACLDPALKQHGIAPWMASEHLTAFGTIFDQIEDKIESAVGAAVFIGASGLGRFQRNIELGAVQTEEWLQGAAYGRLLVHLDPGCDLPRTLLRWPTVNHDGSLLTPEALARGIVQRFGFA